MELMDKRKQDRLIKGIFLNSLIFIVCIVYLVVFLLPKYTDINTVVTKINTTSASITQLEKNGVDKDSFTELITRLGRKKEIPDNIFTDPLKLNKVLAKPETVTKDYLSWLVDENAKISDLDKEIEANEKILGDIIPVFVNAQSANKNSDVTNQITLGSFIPYVEKEILGKYSLTSYVPLGISNITFPDKKDTPINIGNFKVNIDFKGKNSDIQAFVNNIQQSGKLMIRNGKLVSDTVTSTANKTEKGLSNLSNLLINIDSLTLSDIPVNPNAENTGNITLVFYVEGLNYQKIVIIRSLLLEKFDGLQKSVKEKGSLCAKPGNPLCNESVTNNAIVTIKSLIKNLSALQPRVDAFKKGDTTIDVNKEMDALSGVQASLESIEMTYLKNNAILEKAKKQPNTK